MPTKPVVRIGVGVAILSALLVAAWRFWPRPAPIDHTAVAAPTSLEGRWRCVDMESDGKRRPRWQVGAGRIRLTVAGDTLSAPTLFGADSTFSLPGAPANAIDIHVRSDEGQSVVTRGIFARDGDTLRLCLAWPDPEKPRPTVFETRAGDGRTVFVFERISPGEGASETAAEQLGAVLKEARSGGKLPDKAERLAARCLRIAESHPGTDEAAVCLLWVVANAPDGEAGKAALGLLRGGGIAAAGLETLEVCFGLQRGAIGPGDLSGAIGEELAPLLLERVRRTPDHPSAAAVLSSVCTHTAGDGAPDASPVFDEAARMIAERWTTSPDLTHFLETLSRICQRPWARRYERTVRRIMERTPDAYTRHRATFTLAQIVAESGEARQEEARRLYAGLVRDYKPGVVDPSWEGLTKDLVELARREIDAMLVRGVGGPAPDLKGVDLRGKPLALAEYRGKVVLLSFWATWCGPCMRLVPHERALLGRHKGRPFAVVGVNGDEGGKLNRKLLEKNPVPWRSLQNRRPGQKAVSEEWNIAAWPTLFLIDHTGKIRRRWIGTPPQDELDREVERWVAVAEGKPLAPLPRPANAESPGRNKGIPAKFIDKVHTDRQGGESKYVVCVPEDFDPKKPLPVVLFLHGSGQVGADNTKQLGIGLGPAVRKRGMPFPFVGVFPQARGGSWLAGRPDGERALAVLAAVEREYATDTKRVYLTGVSMGGEGVWSLAAAHPKRFAAIVPVCGGGDPKLAAALKDIPCWAFHGEADKIVPAQASRDIVRAITQSGGRPQYQEYRGLGHNCWDRAYAEAELYRWLRTQVRE